MDPMTMIGLGSTIYGGLKTIFGRDPDPYAEQRKLQRQLLSRSKSSGDRIASKAYTSAAINTRNLEDRGAAAGTPQSILDQQIAGSQGAMNQQLLDALFEDEQASIGRESQIISAIPPEQEDTSGEDLLGLGLQMLTLGSGTPSAPASTRGPDPLAFPINTPAPINRITQPNPLSLNTPGGFGRTPAIGPGFRPPQNKIQFGNFGKAFSLNNQIPNLNGYR